jgi:apolipoprotein N-acyltransferase
MGSGLYPRGKEWLGLLGILCICASSYFFMAALLAPGILFYLCGSLAGWQQVGVILGIWALACGVVLFPNFASVKWISGSEQGLGLGLLAFLPVFLGIFTLLTLKLTDKDPPLLRPWHMAAIWTGCDALLDCLQFPIPLHWGSLLTDWLPGIQIADHFGVWGVTYEAIFFSSSLATALQVNAYHRRRILGVAVVVLGVTVTYGGSVLQIPLLSSVSTVNVGVIQPLAWLEKDRSWHYRQQEYTKLFDLSHQALTSGAEVLVWPEGSLRLKQLQDSPLSLQLLDPILQALPQEGVLLLGSTERHPTQLQSFMNAALLYNSSGQLLDQTGKRWIFPWFETKRHQAIRDPYRPLQNNPIGNLGVMICLESVLPDPSRYLVTAGAEVLIAIADDSGFGHSIWPRLHSHFAVLRAIENRRSFLFVNNTGASLIVDPMGRIQASGEVFQPQALVGSVRIETQQTAFQRWGHWIKQGLVVILVASLGGQLFGLRGLSKKTQKIWIAPSLD